MLNAIIAIYASKRHGMKAKVIKEHFALLTNGTLMKVASCHDDSKGCETTQTGRLLAHRACFNNNSFR